MIFFVSELTMKIRFVKANKALNVSTSAMFLALGILFPLLFHAVNLGSQFSPMHLPALLAGMICGPLSGLAVGFLTPLLSSLISGMPPIFPMAIAMAFELAVYGFVSGLFMSIFSVAESKTVKNLSIVLSLVIAMLAGRCVYGLVMWILTAIQGGAYTFAVFIGAVLLDSWPGWILQLLAVPAIMYVLKSAHILEKYDLRPIYEKPSETDGAKES